MMSKRAINIVLLCVSLGIAVFIAHAFYKAFTREHLVPDTAPSPTHSVSGEILVTEAPDIPALTAPLEQMPPAPHEEVGHALEKNPALQQALPPIPEAPAPTESLPIPDPTSNTDFPAPIPHEP